MAKYVELDAVIATIKRIPAYVRGATHNTRQTALYDCLFTVSCMPGVTDLEPVVHCGECEHSQQRECNAKVMHCELYHHGCSPTFFCGSGRRKDMLNAPTGIPADKEKDHG